MLNINKLIIIIIHILKNHVVSLLIDINKNKNNINQY